MGLQNPGAWNGMQMFARNVTAGVWVAHASRVLFSASRRELRAFKRLRFWWGTRTCESVGETPAGGMRDACATLSRIFALLASAGIAAQALSADDPSRFFHDKVDPIFQKHC